MPKAKDSLVDMQQLDPTLREILMQALFELIQLIAHNFETVLIKERQFDLKMRCNSGYFEQTNPNVLFQLLVTLLQYIAPLLKTVNVVARGIRILL